MKILERDTVSRSALDRNSLLRGADLSGMTLQIAAFRRGEQVQDRLNGLPCVGIVASGLLDVSAQQERAVAVSTLEAGDAFGICNVFAARPMPTTLICRRAARVVYLTKEQFAALLDRDPALMRRYLVLCNEKMQFLAERMQLHAGSCRDKLLHYLESHADGDRFVPLPHSKEQLARLLGVSRASLFRELSALSDGGIIVQTPTGVVLSAPPDSRQHRQTRT